MPSSTEPIHVAFLGCGFITRVHSRHIRRIPELRVAGYASRGRAKADQYCAQFGGRTAYAGYAAAIDDPQVDAVVVAVPPRFPRALALQALAAVKHVLVEKPAFPQLDDYRTVAAARDRAGRVVVV